MNRLARWVMRLYPAQWRARYSDEVDALLADTGADARTVADLAKAGVRMQFSTRSFPKLAIALGLAGLVLGGAFSLVLPSQYTSKATMRITLTRIDDTVKPAIFNPLNEQVLELVTQVLSRATLAKIIKDPRLLLYKNQGETLNESVERMKNDIQINFVAAPKTLPRGSAAFDVVFSYPDRYKAQQTVQALMTAFNEVNMTSQMRTVSATDRAASSITVLDEASLPEVPFNRSSIFGKLSGLLGDLFPAQYRSAATLRLTHGTPDQVQALTSRVLSRTNLSAMVNDPRLMLYRDELRTTRLEEVIELMKQHVWVSLLQGKSDSVLFTVAFDYPDRYKARTVVEALTTDFRRADSEMFSVSAPPARAGEILDVLDTASLPTNPSKPKRVNIALAGGLLGIILGALVSIVRRLRIPPAIVTLNPING